MGINWKARWWPRKWKLHFASVDFSDSGWFYFALENVWWMKCEWVIERMENNYRSNGNCCNKTKRKLDFGEAFNLTLRELQMFVTLTHLCSLPRVWHSFMSLPAKRTDVEGRTKMGKIYRSINCTRLNGFSISSFLSSVTRKKIRFPSKGKTSITMAIK